MYTRNKKTKNQEEKTQNTDANKTPQLKNY